MTGPVRAAFLSAIVTAAALALPAVPAAAQTATGTDMTEEQILDAFARQKTRGLVIAPSGQAAGDAGGVAVRSDAAPETSDLPQASLDAVPLPDQVNVNVTFDFDSAALRPDQRPRLAALCTAMQKADVEQFRILGHTDASGSADYNEALSLLRAEEVKRYLVADCGIAPERMIAVGVGERFPYDAADPRADVNRRVEFQVLG